MQWYTKEQKENFMRIALLESCKAAAKGEVPVGAVIVNASGKILSKAFNRRECKHDATAHAETTAIRKACKKIKDFRLQNCCMFVTLEPCPMCAGAIVNARISKVFYGAKSDRSEKELLEKIFCSQKLNHQCETEGGILEEECSAVIKDFFKKIR